MGCDTAGSAGDGGTRGSATPSSEGSCSSAPRRQSCGNAGLGLASCDLYEKSEILIFMWYFMILNAMGANETHL